MDFPQLGNVQSAQDSSDSRQLSVEEVYVAVGEEVKEGDPILKVTDSALESIREDLSGDVSEARLVYEQMVTQQEQTEAEASAEKKENELYGQYADTEYNLTVNELTDAVEELQESIAQAQESVTQQQAKLAERNEELSDAGSKMEAASASNETLTLLLAAMAIIVFIVGGIGIMNVLFVSVRERTNEIGILKAIGCTKKDILLEFLLEAACISFIGSVLGVLLALGITPVIEELSVRVELSVWGGLLSLLFGCLTGTIFGFYPAWKASRLIPVVALNHE